MPNLISPTSWTTGGPGAVTAGTTLALTGTGTGTTYARQPVATEVGATYWFVFEVLTSTVLPGRLVGTSEGGGQVVAPGTASAWSNRIEFVATTPTTWIQLQRQNAGEAQVNAVRVEKVTEANHPARRCNGVNQYLQVDALAAGLRTANYNWYVGGWIRFDVPTATTTYVADFGRAEATASGGAGRVRLAAGTGADVKIFCSTSLFDGTRYRELAFNANVAADTWYHIGFGATSSADLRLTWNGTEPGTATGTVPTLSESEVCRVLRIGAKVASPASGHSPVSYSDWIWCSGFLPTTEQIQALAAGTRPGDVAGFAPSFHWPMAVDGGTETALVGAQPLAATGTPRLSVGPAFGVEEPVAATTPPDIIVV